MQPRFPRNPLRPLALAALLAALVPLHPLQAADSPAAARLETPALPAPPDGAAGLPALGIPSLGIQALPGKTTLLAPKGKIKTATPAYRWKKVTGATYYYLFVPGKTPDAGVATWYSAKQVGCASATTCTVTPPVSLPNGAYRWWVLSWNASGFGPWSAPLSFTVAVASTTALNDTGITTCASSNDDGFPCPLDDYPRQDAEFGRDATHPDDSDGHAGFSFEKLDATGRALPASATAWACVRDKVTGLVWENKTADGGLRDGDWTYTWYDPSASDPGTADGGECSKDGRCDTAKYAQDVNQTKLCGFADWRLPSPRELAGLVDYSIAYPGPAIDTGYFLTPATGGWFWSSSSSAYDPDGAWYVDFRGGHVFDYYTFGYNHVRLVHGEQSWSFVDRQNGTVDQVGTGLTWAKCAEGLSGTACTAGTAKEMNWQEALQAANDSRLGGHGDWRLPNVKELQSLVDYSKYNPAIDASVFPSTPGGWFWSSSSYADSPGYAWYVAFYYGYIGNGYGKNYAGYVRLVRGGQ